MRDWQDTYGPAVVPILEQNKNVHSVYGWMPEKLLYISRVSLFHRYVPKVFGMDALLKRSVADQRLEYVFVMTFPTMEAFEVGNIFAN